MKGQSEQECKMSKHHEQMNYLIKSPKAMMDFQLKGKLPNAVKPASPLITFLESIYPRDRINMTGVKLVPELGYECCIQFRNAEQLLRYLKPKEWIVNGSWPAESRRNKRFHKKITMDDFIAAQKKYGVEINTK